MTQILVNILENEVFNSYNSIILVQYVSYPYRYLDDILYVLALYSIFFFCSTIHSTPWRNSRESWVVNEDLFISCHQNHDYNCRKISTSTRSKYRYDLITSSKINIEINTEILNYSDYRLRSISGIDHRYIDPPRELDWLGRNRMMCSWHKHESLG